MSYFKDEWVQTNTKMLSLMYPDMDKKEIKKFVTGEYKKNVKDIPCSIHNNYMNKRINTTIIEVMDWIKKTSPICAGHGVFFKNQNQVVNPMLKMILKFIASRKFFKNKLSYIEDTNSYEYKANDRFQMSEKVTTNSLYGALGMMMSFIFNLYTAPSVTSTGQSLISTTEQSFEYFMSGNVVFDSMNECVQYITNIIEQKPTMDDSFLNDVDIDTVVEWIVSKFHKYKDTYDVIVYNILVELDQSTLNRLYYKNNLYKFSDHNEIRNLLTRIVENTVEFKNPNDVPDVCEDEVQQIWNYYEEFVVYNFSPFNRIQKLVHGKRKTVVTIDTDSNMLNLDPWVQYMFNTIIDPNVVTSQEEIDRLTFISVNTMAVIITKTVTKILAKYTEDSNVPEEYRHYVNMKNEFLFSFMLLANVKKRYITSVRLREGKEIYPEKVDIKGFDFVKSGTSEEVMATYKQIVKKRLIETKNISIKDIMNDLQAIENDITGSLKRGEKKYITPASVNEFEAYSQGTIFQQQPVMATLAWNALYPDSPIQLPAKIDIVKVNLNTLEKIEKLKNVDNVIYNNAINNIVNSKNSQISKKLLYVIAIPKNIERIPEWIIPFIDYDTISGNVLEKFYPVLDSLGMSTAKTSKREYFSNIINI